ncbi:MAG: CHAP domain-containing protein [Ruminococcaceae bacterium]|nr:CHAP domain-containing protein [Oscillospiraceae bacterium]
MRDLSAAAVFAAQGFLGCSEKDGSHKKIIDLYNSQEKLPRGYGVKYTDAWCAAFVSAIGVKLGISHILLPECGVGDMVALYKKENRFRSPKNHTPKPGELIVYDWSGDGRGDHIGIVEAYEKGKLTVIEGNYKDSVGRREVTKSSKHILGYCLPDYESYSGKIDTVGKVQQYLNFTYGAKLTVDGIAGPKTKKALLAGLQTEWKIDPDGIFGPITARAANKNVVGKGCCSETVRLLQMLLLCAGYKLTADGIFGSKTENALVAFQKKVSLAPDGLAGKNTFKKLTMDN